MKHIYLFPIVVMSTLGVGMLSNSLPYMADRSLAASTEIPVAAQDTTKVQYVREGGKKKKTKAPKVKTTRVNFTREVQRASLSKQSDEGNFVDIVVMQSGRIVRNLEDLQMVGSNGNQIAGNNFMGFENIAPPFEGSVRFKATNNMGTASYDREVRFTIMEKGRWVLKIDL